MKDMPLSYEIDEERKLMTVIADERLTYEDVMAHQRALLSEPRLKEPLLCLVDLRKISMFGMSGRDVLKLAQTRGDFPFLAMNLRTAVVVNSAAIFAMARMYALSRRKFVEPMAIFYDMDEARQWLLQPGSRG